jgi:hypothetical protein
VVKPIEDRHEYVDRALRNALMELNSNFPGITRSIKGDEYIINIPSEQMTSHEDHFAEVFKTFIAYLDSGKLPPEENSNTLSKYILLAEAQKIEQ